MFEFEIDINSSEINWLEDISVKLSLNEISEKSRNWSSLKWKRKIWSVVETIPKVDWTDKQVGSFLRQNVWDGAQKELLIILTVENEASKIKGPNESNRFLVCLWIILLLGVSKGPKTFWGRKFKWWSPFWYEI